MTQQPVNIDLAPLEARLGYSFQNRRVLEEALTHASTDAHCDETHKNYERLEFLGDRVLGLIIAEMLLVTFQDETEGDIAKRHTALVQARALAEVAQTIELGNYLNLSRGEHNSGGRRKMALLADATESVLGAIYLDGGIEPARKFIEQYWRAKMESFDFPPIDTKTHLQEWAQKRGLPLPEYILLDTTGPAHKPVFTVEARVEGLEPAKSEGNSKRDAQKKAARILLQAIAALESEEAEKDAATDEAPEKEKAAPVKEEPPTQPKAPERPRVIDKTVPQPAPETETPPKAEAPDKETQGSTS